MTQIQKISTWKLNSKINGVWIGLIAQFLLGVVLRFYGNTPGELNFRTEPMIIKMAFIAHVINGVTLILGATYVLKSVYNFRIKQWNIAAGSGLMFILISGSSGLRKFHLPNLSDSASTFLMAMGFFGAFFSYGVLYFLIRYFPAMGKIRKISSYQSPAEAGE